LAIEKIRLDQLVMDHGFAESLVKARSLILSGSILVDNIVQTKVGYCFPVNSKLRVKEKIKTYVSRGAYKLLGALEIFSDFPINEKFCIDLGSSTGGFTQVLLEKGAEKVLAIDVGYGQLMEKIRQDDRVKILDRFHFKNLTWSDIPITQNQISVTCDLSFISIENVFAKLMEIKEKKINTKIFALLMVKPQFEIDQEFLTKGIVKDIQLSYSILRRLIRLARNKYKAKFKGLAKSPILGAEGNQEFFIYLIWE
jgi:23S rRNA (cytidine1920-2'-O)/16S rRNA (cytidine1409-2'-O)-methyltransferase